MAVTDEGTNEEEAPSTAWLTDEGLEGQLAVDVFQTPTDIIITSAIAGVSAEDLDIAVHRDMVTIRGRRKQDTETTDREYLFQECYWGGFSRTIILPVEVQSDRANASLKNGILTLRLPKAKRSGPRTVRVKSVE